MAYELKKRQLRFERQKLIPIVYEGFRLEKGFRADFIVEDLLINKKQLLTYLRHNAFS